MVSPARFEEVVRLLQHLGQLLSPNKPVTAITVKVTAIIIMENVIVVIMITLLTSVQLWREVGNVQSGRQLL